MPAPIARLHFDEPVEIRRGVGGYPSIAAETLAGALFGQGWIAAHDRGLPLVLGRLLASGRMAEHLGGTDELVEIDRYFRRQGFVRDAEAEADRLAPPARRQVEAWCAGVSTRLAAGVPWELRIAGYRHLEPWTVANTIAFSRLMAWLGLQQSQGEIERLIVEMIQAGIDRPRLDEMFPGQLDGLNLELVRGVELGERVVPARIPWVPKPLASNNWAIAPARSASGRALLANDPHLEVNRLPPVFQPLRLQWAGRSAVGASVPGLPGLLAARTPDLAWGLTYGFVDGVDSWIEDCAAGRVRRADGFESMAIARETIARRGKSPVVVDVVRTSRGLLDGDASARGLRLATRWSAAERAGARSLESVVALLEARSCAEGLGLLGRIETPWAFVAADAAGHIGMQVSGLAPRRRPGWSGLVPIPAWEVDSDWRGFHSPEELPREFDPERGFVFTANQDLGRFGSAPAINAAMADDRAERIAELLAASQHHSVGDLQRIQLDLVSREGLAWRELLRPLLDDGAAARALASWDGRYDPDSLGATAFETFHGCLFRETFADCGSAVLAHLAGETAIVADFSAAFSRVMTRERSAWFRGRTREQVWAAAWAEARRDAPVRWGKLRTIAMNHLLFGGKLPRWAGFDRDRIELPGGRATIRQGQVFRSGGRTTTFAPALRMVTDFAESAVHLTIPGGPSDRRFSRFYDSSLAEWIDGRLSRLELFDT